MKTVYSLGCSFMCDDTWKITEPSFIQQFCHKHQYEYHCLARPGVTNYTIRLQIDHAIRCKPDLIVLGATSGDRIDIVLNDDWRSPIQLEHIVYQGYLCSSEKEINNREAFIASDTLNNLIQSHNISISDNKRSALKSYVAELHDPGLQISIDACVIRDGIRNLQDSGIPFIFLPGPMFYMDWNWLGDNVWPTDKPQPWDLPCGTYNINNHNPPQAHTIFLETLENLAEKVCQ